MGNLSQRVRVGLNQVARENNIIDFKNKDSDFKPGRLCRKHSNNKWFSIGI